MNRNRQRRIIAGIVLLVLAVILIIVSPGNYRAEPANDITSDGTRLAVEALDELPVKGRAPLTGYDRSYFGEGWSSSDGCDMRNRILLRDLHDVKIDDRCRVLSGKLIDPYTGKTIVFQRGSQSSSMVHIDHVVALADAWQKGAQLLTAEERIAFANDPLELLAVDGDANEQKSNSDAASWLPPYKPFRCQYVARQIAVKLKYELWVTAAEYSAIKRVLGGCPGQNLPRAA